MKKFLRFLSNLAFHPHMAIRLLITLVYTGPGLYVNFFGLQIFCRPVAWAAVWSVLAFLSVIIFPYLSNIRLRQMAYFVMGSGVPVQVYLIIFLADPWNGMIDYGLYILCVFFIGLGLLAFIPFYYLYHTYRYTMQARTDERLVFITGIVVPLLALMVFSILLHYRYNDLHRSLASTEKFDARIADKLRKDYVTERILGIGFLYHTKIECIYDGWRPPLHDPFINTCLWFNRKNTDKGYLGLPHDLGVKRQYYHYLFPDNPLRVSCPCAYNSDGMSYFRE